MKNKITQEVVVPFTLIILAVLLLNPFNFWMPNMMVLGMLLFALILFAIFASFILKEKVFDERDNVNRSLAGRNAFLAGSAVLLLGILVQGYYHSVDAWLVIALVAMIIVKIATRAWSDKNL
jgi:hypothetical protein